MCAKNSTPKSAVWPFEYPLMVVLLRHTTCTSHNLEQNSIVPYIICNTIISQPNTLICFGVGVVGWKKSLPVVWFDDFAVDPVGLVDRFFAGSGQDFFGFDLVVS